MKKIVLALLSIAVLGCIYNVDKSMEDIPISAQLIGEINCSKNYKVFRVTDPIVISVEKFMPTDTLTLNGVKYNNVFFAEISDDIIQKSRFEKMILNEYYLVYGFSPLQRNSIACDKYKNHFEKLRIKSIN